MRGTGASLVPQIIKNLPTMQDIQVRSLGEKDPLEKGLATHSTILVYRVPWTEKPGGLQVWWAKIQTQLSDFQQ